MSLEGRGQGPAPTAVFTSVCPNSTFSCCELMLCASERLAGVTWDASCEMGREERGAAAAGTSMHRTLARAALCEDDEACRIWTGEKDRLSIH